MAFPNYPTDGDIYIDQTTNRKYVYSLSDSQWKIKGRCEIKEYGSLTGSIEIPTEGDSLLAAASGTEYEPAAQVSNNWQARDVITNNYGYTYTSFSNYDFPPGSLRIDGNNNLTQKASSSVYSGERMRTVYSSNTFGAAPSTSSYAPGNGFCWTFKIDNPVYANLYLINMIIYGIEPNLDYQTKRLYYRGFLIKGRTITQRDIDSVISTYTIQDGGRAVGIGNSQVTTGSQVYLNLYNNKYPFQGTYGDEYTMIWYNQTNSDPSKSLVLNNWTGDTPVQNENWKMLTTEFEPGIVYPAGYSAPTPVASAGATLPFYTLFQVNSQNSATNRYGQMGVLDYYTGDKNQVADNQRMEILSSTVTPTYSQFLPDGYTIYNSTTSALNYWDSNTSSWVAI